MARHRDQVAPGDRPGERGGRSDLDRVVESTRAPGERTRRTGRRPCARAVRPARAARRDGSTRRSAAAWYSARSASSTRKGCRPSSLGELRRPPAARRPRPTSPGGGPGRHPRTGASGAGAARRSRQSGREPGRRAPARRVPARRRGGARACPGRARERVPPPPRRPRRRASRRRRARHPAPPRTSPGWARPRRSPTATVSGRVRRAAGDRDGAPTVPHERAGRGWSRPGRDPTSANVRADWESLTSAVPTLSLRPTGVPVYGSYGTTNVRSVRRTPGQPDAGRAGSRSATGSPGSRSASGASHEARSNIRGWGTTRSGSSTVCVADEQHVDVEGPRAPTLAADPVRLAPRGAGPRASSCRGVERGVDGDDGVEVLAAAPDRRPGRSRRPARHATATDDVGGRRQAVDRELQVREPVPEVRPDPEVRARRHGRHRCRRTQRSIVHGDVVDHRPHRRVQLAYRHRDRVHALVDAAHLGDARREPFEQRVPLGA